MVSSAGSGIGKSLAPHGSVAPPRDRKQNCSSVTLYVIDALYVLKGRGLVMRSIELKKQLDEVRGQVLSNGLAEFSLGGIESRHIV